MMTCEVTNGWRIDTNGDRGFRRGSSKPQLAVRCSLAATDFLRSFAASASKTSFFPLRLPFFATPLTGGLAVTAAFRAATKALTYSICPSFAPFSIGPIAVVSLHVPVLLLSRSLPLSQLLPVHSTVQFIWILVALFSAHERQYLVLTLNTFPLGTSEIGRAHV